MSSSSRVYLCAGKRKSSARSSRVTQNFARYDEKTRRQQPREIRANSSYVLTIVDLCRGQMAGKPVAAITYASTHAATFYLVRGLTRLTTCAYISSSHTRRQRCMIDAPMRTGHQRRDISTLEIGQWPCASRPYVLILLNPARTCSPSPRFIYGAIISRDAAPGTLESLVKIDSLFLVKPRRGVSQQ